MPVLDHTLKRIILSLLSCAGSAVPCSVLQGEVTFPNLLHGCFGILIPTSESIRRWRWVVQQRWGLEGGIVVTKGEMTRPKVLLLLLDLLLDLVGMDAVDGLPRAVHIMAILLGLS